MVNNFVINLCLSFNEAIRLGPFDETTWNNKGFTLDNFEKYEEA